MQGDDALLGEIEALLAAGEERDDPSRLERTLTDGYARALLLEAEHLRLARRTGAGGDPARQRELERELHDLRAALARLRRRHSRAVRVVRR